MNDHICPQANHCEFSPCTHRVAHERNFQCCADCDEKPNKDASIECVRIVQNRGEDSRIAQVRVIMGSYWGGCFVAFRSQFEIDNDLRGKTYRNPTPESLDRLHLLLYEASVHCFVDHRDGDIIFGDLTPLPDLFVRVQE